MFLGEIGYLISWLKLSLLLLLLSVITKTQQNEKHTYCNVNKILKVYY